MEHLIGFSVLVDIDYFERFYRAFSTLFSMELQRRLETKQTFFPLEILDLFKPESNRQHNVGGDQNGTQQPVGFAGSKAYRNSEDGEDVK